MMDNARAALDHVAGWAQTDVGKAALAGAAGGLVRWLTLRENWRDGVVSLVVGGICAIFLWPLAEPFLRPFVGAISPGNSGQSLGGFVVGLGGIGVTGFVIDILRAGRARVVATPPAPAAQAAPMAQVPPVSVQPEGGGHDQS